SKATEEVWRGSRARAEDGSATPPPCARGLGVVTRSGTIRSVAGPRPTFSGTRLRPQDSLPEHLKRIEAYMRGCGLLVYPREPSERRTELAEFIAAHLDEFVDEWVDQLSEAVRIPEDQRHGLRHDIYAATVRWIRHIENPEDVETYHFLQAHARRTFI